MISNLWYKFILSVSKITIIEVQVTTIRDMGLQS